MRYYIIAGEASGDLHGSNLIRGLRAEDPQADIRFWGGAMMQEAGGTMVRDYGRAGAVMGFTDIVRKLGSILSSLRFCKQDILAWKPDAVILIDYPGFNMKIARFCHEHGIRVFYYIAPKTWASRESRNRKLKAWVDRLYIVFPFEVPYFTERSIPFTYKGNPLVDAVDRVRFSRPLEGRYIAILAGSRKGEVSRMMPVCMEVADRLRALPAYADCRFLVAGAPGRCAADYAPFLKGREDYVQVLFDRTYDVLKFADAAIINSGTASLEAALIGTPQVVCWSTTLLTALLAKYVLRVLDHIKFISLGNLIVDRLVFKELIQFDFTADAVTQEVRHILEDGAYRGSMLSGYQEIRERLGGGGASRAVAADMILRLSDRK